MHRTRQMHFAVFAQGLGAAQSVWRSPRTSPERVHTLDHWMNVARTAEAGTFDALFIADALTLGTGVAADATERPDPVAILSALSAVTSDLGLIGTSSTTYNDPFTVARQFATLDHLSGGRAGWNIVTTAIAAAAENYGAEGLPDHELRYERGEEFVEVVTRLWDTWDDDAMVLDRDRGTYADLDRIHRIDYSGKHFQVRGPLTVPRPPQGRPLLVQAGSSPTGMRLAARFADMVFTTQFDVDEAKRFAAELRQLVRQVGRDPETVAVMPGVTPIIGRTESEARELAAELGEVVRMDATLAFMRQMFGGIDFSQYALDEPFPDIADLLPPNASISRPTMFIRMAQEENLTLRQVAQRISLSTGHRCLVGTPDQIADDLALWFSERAADGFNLMPADLPGGLRDFVQEVVPRLRDRGLFRREYESHSLRGHLGVPAPPVTTPRGLTLRETG